MSALLDRISGWFKRTSSDVETEVHGGEPATTAPPGTDGERETSTNAQTQGASDEPWPGR